MIAEITTEGNSLTIFDRTTGGSFPSGFKVNIIIVHPWDVVFPRAKLEGKQHPKGEEL
jgi:hypothetical protein